MPSCVKRFSMTLTWCCVDLSMTDISSIRIANFTRVNSRSLSVAGVQTLQDTGLSNDLCVVSVRSIELFAILVPSDKHLRSSSEGALESQLLAHWDGNILQFLHKASRF